MCHNYNFSDDHRGHKVVGLEDAYRILRTENIGKSQIILFLENLTLMSTMNKFVGQRLRYLDRCRITIKSDREKAEKQIADYFAEIIKDFKIQKAKKIQELNNTYASLDSYMKKNEQACQKFIKLSKEILDISPDSLYEVLKQYNRSTGFIKSVSNGINFPPENAVDITLKSPNYKIITDVIQE